jgi:RHS repeat-associated protein
MIIVCSYTYEPFGKQITLFSESQTRLSFIGKEKDIESELGDFGVRKYDEVQGRFTSIDPSPTIVGGRNTIAGNFQK